MLVTELPVQSVAVEYVSTVIVTAPHDIMRDVDELG